MGSRDEVPQKLKQLADIVYRFWPDRNDQNLKISYNSPPWFLTSMFHGGEAKRHFGGFSPYSPRLDPPLQRAESLHPS